jgi:serine/threonine-protein kinase
VSSELALRIVAQVCMGLQKAHEANVVHRDIKPANIFLAKSDGGSVLVKVLDFGIAKVKMETASEAGDAGLTRTGTMLGSPLYMSPEQARGSKSIDHRADLWSLGVVLYELICGRTPFHHIEALGELIIAICSEAPRPVQDFAPWAPPEVAAIIHKSLRVNAAERYQTAAEMLEAVRALLPSTSVEESMLVSLSETQRNAVARRLTLPPPNEAVAASMPPPNLSQPPPPNEGGGTTGGISAPTERRPQLPQRSSAPLLVLGTAIGIAIAGVVAYKVVGSQQQAGANAAAANIPAEAPRENAGASTAATAAGPNVSPVPQERTVKLVVLPEEAKVTVDGKEATVKKGYVEISGTLGSVHKVKLTAFGRDVEEDITISENGPQPPKVEVEDTKKAAPGGATPKAPSTAAPGPGPGAQPKPPGGIEEKFE